MAAAGLLFEQWRVPLVRSYEHGDGLLSITDQAAECCGGAPCDSTTGAEAAGGPAAPVASGKGHGAATTRALCLALREQGITTIGLNVTADNAAAISMYERLGFRLYREAGSDWVLVRDL